MHLLIIFLLGTLLGSFYNRVGKRLPHKENLLKSDECSHCRYTYKIYEFSHILQYFIRSGRCPRCRKRLDIVPVLNEFFTGLLFTISYSIFGLSNEFLISLGIVSMFMIILISDFSYMIISDEVLIFFNTYFIILLVFTIGVPETIYHILSGVFLFLVMYFIMLLGNFLLKGESLGGGDVKMMFTFGLLLGPVVGIFSIFLSSFIALPVSLINMYLNKDHMIPFGPFLLISLLFLFLMGIDSKDIVEAFQMI